MSNGHGGARPGAGRKRKAEKYAGQIAAAEDLIADKLPEILGKALELVNGIEVQKIVRGNPVVYSEPPCARTIAYLVDRILGKPTQAVEVTGEEGGPIEITATHRAVAQIEMDEWRAEMKERLSSLQNAPPTTGTSSTPTG